MKSLPLDNLEIISLFQNGIPATKIANKYNCSNVTIRNRLLKYNIDTNIHPLRNNINIHFFDELNEYSAYWLGFFIADGNIYRNQISIALANKDLEHLKILNSLIGSTHKVQFRKDKPNCRFHITNKYLRKMLNNFGITENKTYTVKFPSIDSKLYPHLIRGIFDGDGSAHIDKRWNSLIIDFNGNKYILEKINSIIHNEVGISLKRIHLTNSNHKTLRIRYCGKEAKRVCAWMYKDANVYLKRKKMVVEDAK